jgi:hypothetical protein
MSVTSGNFSPMTPALRRKPDACRLEHDAVFCLSFCSYSIGSADGSVGSITELFAHKIAKISKGSGTDFLATQLYSARMLASPL